MLKHGFARQGCSLPPEYSSWKGMRDRCYRKKCKDYPRYGGRGIGVYREWLISFAAFLRDMGSRPSPDHSLDRIDSNGDYAPGNVRWANHLEQQNNRRDNRAVTINGETLTIAQWARRIGIGHASMRRRILCGWTDDRLLLPPKHTQRHAPNGGDL